MGEFEQRVNQNDVAANPNAAFDDEPIIGHGPGVGAQARQHVAPQLDPATAAGKALGSTYVDDARAQYIHEHPSKAATSKMWDDISLDSREDRLKAMAGMTQTDKDQCAGSSVVAAALYGGGSQGIASLAEQIKKAHADDKNYDTTGLDELAKRAKDGKLTPADIASMQENVQSEMVQLQDKMLKDPNSGFSPEARAKLKDLTQDGESTTGINPLVLQTFMSQNPELSKEFKDKGMGIKMIDPNGKGDPAHYVLDIQDGNNPRAIYDPAMKKSGGQVVTDSKQLDLYDHTKSIGQDIKPKDPAPPPVVPAPVIAGAAATATGTVKAQESHWYNPFSWF